MPPEAGFNSPPDPAAPPPEGQGTAGGDVGLPPVTPPSGRVVVRLFLVPALYESLVRPKDSHAF